MAHKPIIFVGIGSSGLYVLEQIQNFCYENTGKNRPSWAQYLYIETNKDNQPAITAEKNEINRVYISLNEMDTMIKEIKAEGGNNIDWLPPEDHVLDAGLGAGGIPSCGRLAMWGRNQQSDNIQKVIREINRLHHEVAGVNAKGTDGQEPAVYITGSVTGGTGSGIFIDLAYLIRAEIPGIKEIYALLLLPPKKAILNGSEIIYSNAMGALRALEFYNEATRQYVMPRSKTSKNETYPPFELTQMISQSYNDATPQLSSLAGLYKIAGLYLFLNMMGLRAKRFERLVDAKGNMQIGKYGTFGLSAIQYPKAQIQEYLSIELGIKLLNRWIDSGFYFQANQKLPIDHGKIATEVTREFDRILREAFNALDAAGGRSLLNAIRKEAKAINRGEKGDKFQHLYDLYSPANAQGYYTFVQNNLQVALDYIIDSISNFVIEGFNKHENLYYTRYQLSAFAEYIKNILGYWKKIGISSYQNKWEAFLGDRQVTWMLNNLHKHLGEQDNVLVDRMKSTLDLLKMHLFVKKMLDIRQNIIDSDIPLSTATKDERVELPTINRINTLIKAIERGLGNREDNEKDLRFKSLSKRLLEIEGDMNDKTIPILRIFPSGSFELERKHAYERYKNDSGQSSVSKETLIGDRNLWDYLNHDELYLHRTLYHDVIIKFKHELDNYNAVRDYDVSDYVRRNPRDAANFAARAISFMLPVRRNMTLRSSQNIPRAVVGSDKSVIQSVIQMLHSENFSEFKNDGDQIKEIPELRNLMVFYIEQGNFSPEKDLSYAPEVEQVDQNHYKDLPGMTLERWYNFRNPYLPRDVVKKLVAASKEKSAAQT